MISPTALPCPRALDPVREPALGGGDCLLWRRLGRGVRLRGKRQGDKGKRNGYFAKSCAWPGWSADGAVLWNHLHVV